MKIFTDKSLVTNLICLALVLAGFFLPESPLKGPVLYTGLFAFSGSLTNWIAVQMIFEKVPLLYGSGVVVTRFESFKEAIGRMIVENFFTEENFNKLKSKESGFGLDASELCRGIDLDSVFDELKQVILESSLGGALSMFGGESLIEKFREEFKNRMGEKLPKLMEKGNIDQIISEATGFEKIKDRIEAMIDEKLNELTPGEVKIIVEKMIKKHLGWLVVWGGFFGGLIGAAGHFLIRI